MHHFAHEIIELLYIKHFRNKCDIVEELYQHGIRVKFFQSENSLDVLVHGMMAYATSIILEMSIEAYIANLT